MHFGVLPTQAQQQEFFASVRGMGAQATIEHIENVLQRETVSERFAEGGEFLPLSVWETRGFDISKFENCREEDKAEHELFGMTYRIRIRSKHTEFVRETSRTSAKKARTSGALPSLPGESSSPPPIDGPSGPLAIEDKKRNSSSSSTSSTSSSSSSDHKKKKSKKDKKHKKSNKKHKKGNKKDKKDKKGTAKDVETPADRKKREAAEKAASKAVEKQQSQEVRAAQMVLTKMEPVIAALQGMSQKEHFALICSSIREQLLSTLQKLLTLRSEANRVLADGHGLVSTDIKMLTIDISEARKIMALASSMLALIQRGIR